MYSSNSWIAYNGFGANSIVPLKKKNTNSIVHKFCIICTSYFLLLEQQKDMIRIINQIMKNTHSHQTIF
jgi:hypothetical protein